MSERWNIPKSKGVGEKLTLGIIGLVGVLVGSLISIGSNYFLAVRAERTAQENAQRTRNAEMKVAARLVSDQLAAVAAGAQMLSEEKKLPEKALRFPLDAWDQNKAPCSRVTWMTTASARSGSPCFGPKHFERIGMLP